MKRFNHPAETVFLVIILAGVFFPSGEARALNVGTGSMEEPFKVPHMTKKIKIDALMNEAAWNGALKLVVNTEVEPGENIPAPVKMEVYLLYDESNLYVLFRSFDPDPSQIRARYCDRDALWNDDWVAIFIDTFNDGRRDYGYICNPFGVQSDIVESEMGGNSAWDAIWDSAGRVTSDGYIVEMAIPFNSLSFQRSESNQVWGLDLVRSYPRDVRHHIGLWPRDRNNNCYMCQAQKISGFARIEPGKNIEIAPTISGIFTQEREGYTSGDFVEKEKSFDPGVTMRWGFTPNMTLSATGNPDFSQVESDAMQLDINTQFALYYPEKRPFFLEGADFFNTHMRTVHTRSFSDPDWGIKLSGKEGRNAIGFFSVQDRITNLTFPAQEYSDAASLDQRSVGTVLRYRRDVKSSSNIGFLISDREGKDYYNRVGVIDGKLKFNKKDQMAIMFIGSVTSYPEQVAADYGQPEGSLEGGATEIYYLHGTKSLDWYAIYRAFSPQFRTDIGFFPRVDYNYTEAGFGYTWNNDPDNWWNMMNFGACHETEHDFSGERLLVGYSWWYNYRGKKQSELDLVGFGRVQRYGGEDFYLKGLIADTGFYPFGAMSIFLHGVVREAIDYSNIQDGLQMMINPVIEYRIGTHLSLGIDHTYERFNVDDGRLYDANISRVNLVYQFNRRTFFRWIGQHRYYKRSAGLYLDDIDPTKENFFNQLLFSYKINPQTVLFLGYSDIFYGGREYVASDEYREIDPVQTDRTFFMKIGYAWAQ
ncbi:MAG: carbohydrate binding family 9 domain-containing protein [Candidatus Krumholzibacteriota bacterium]|nr:carbohydrate binding family 9 domain-containing protein [Candidatus Krumholzibacteriota bacterium]